MTFAVAADAYDRFMGRYASLLAPQFAEFARIESSERVLDVGCGPGALTAELVRRVGDANVAAVDPSAEFADAARERFPGSDVRRAAAEDLPFADDTFDAALAQLVVHFLAAPVTALVEIARVTRRGGRIAACVWDVEGESPLTPFWRAVREHDPEVGGESKLPGVREGELAELFEAAGLRRVESGVVSAVVTHATFEEWWDPFTLGVGPAGAYVAKLEPARRDALRDRCRQAVPPPPFVLRMRAWAARGVV